MAVEGLGLSEDDHKELISKITIVFHCAANVRFDLPLKDAVNMNTLGTNRLLQLAEQMPLLKVNIRMRDSIYSKSKQNELLYM